MTDETTPLDLAHAAMEAAPEDGAARLRFYERLADSELFLLLENDSDGESIDPQVFPLEGGPVVLVFDREYRLAEFLGKPAPYAALSGRQAVKLLAGRAIGLGVNLGSGASEIILPAGAVDWLADMLGHRPEETEERGRDVAEVAAEKRAAFAAADVALAASGTVSLELAAAGTPMVIGYDVNWLTRLLVRWLLLVDTVTLVNLVSETRSVPEFTGTRCRPDLLAPALLDVIAHPEKQAEAMRLTMDRLGRGQEAPGLRAARAVLDGIAAKGAV